MYRHTAKRQRHDAAATASSKLDITWPHLTELAMARQSSIISRNVQSNEMGREDNHDFLDDTISQSTSFYADPAYTQTIISQHSFNSKVLRHYQYATSDDASSVTNVSHRPHIPPYGITDSIRSSPRAVKRSTAHSDPPRTKKKRSDGTETSNSWQAEKIEESVAYKARAKRLWKAAQKSPAQFQAVV